MGRFVSSSYWLSSIQNAMSAMVFSILLTAQLSALLLYHNPRSGWLWFWSVKLNRLSGPALHFLDDFFPAGPLLSCVMLAMLCAAPVVVQARRSWLGVFMLGHLALLVCVLSAARQLKNGPIYFDYASLERMVGDAMLHWDTAVLTMAAAAFLVVCPLNYLLYLKVKSAHLPEEFGQDSHRRCLCSYSTILCTLIRCYRMATEFLAARQKIVLHS